MSAATLLVDTARRGELHHSVILAGPAQKQLRDLAIGIAKALNCLNGTAGDDCVSCQKIDRGTHPDVHLITVAEERKLISVEQVRNLVNSAALRPYEGRYKTFIIDPAEALSVSGENALLKTLEEPTRDTVFLLLARSADLLLPTIRSRSQAINISPAFTEDRLRQLAFFQGEDVAAIIARDTLQSLLSAAQGNSAALLRIAAELSSQDDASSALGLLVAIFRDLAALAPEESFDAHSFAELQRAFTREQFLECASLALRALTRLEVNADVRLMIEQALAPLARR